MTNPYIQPARFVVITIPKAGTHLLDKTLKALDLTRATLNLMDSTILDMIIDPRDGVFNNIGDPEWRATSEIYNLFASVCPGEYPIGHLHYSVSAVMLLQDLCYKKIVVIRDPRDIAVSTSYWNIHPNNPFKEYFLNLPDDDARLLTTIKGLNPAETGRKDLVFPSIGTNIGLIAPWIYEPNTLIVRFEDLVGEKGGGSRSKQLQVIGDICNFINLPKTAAEIEDVADRTFDSSSYTFRNGQIGSWKNHFKPEHIQAFNDYAGAHIAQFGYADPPPFSGVLQRLSQFRHPQNWLPALKSLRKRLF
jgi:hypothetical protein